MNNPYVTLLSGIIRCDAAWSRAFCDLMASYSDGRNAHHYRLVDDELQLIGITCWSNAVSVGVRGIEGNPCDVFLSTQLEDEPTLHLQVATEDALVLRTIRYLGSLGGIAFGKFTWSSGEGFDPLIVIAHDEFFSQSVSRCFEGIPSSQPFANALYGPHLDPVLWNGRMHMHSPSIFVFEPSVARWEAIMRVVGQMDCVVAEFRIEEKINANVLPSQSWMSALAASYKLDSDTMLLPTENAAMADILMECLLFDSPMTLMIPSRLSKENVTRYVEFAKRYEAWYDSDFADIQWMASTGRGPWERVTLVCHDRRLANSLREKLEGAISF